MRHLVGFATIVAACYACGWGTLCASSTCLNGVPVCASCVAGASGGGSTANCSCTPGYYPNVTTPGAQGAGCQVCPASNFCSTCNDGASCSSCVLGASTVGAVCMCNQPHFFVSSGVCTQKLSPNFTAVTPTESSLYVTWSNASGGADVYYTLQFGASPSSMTVVYNGTNRYFNVTQLAPGTAYALAIAATDNTTNSSYSTTYTTWTNADCALGLYWTTPHGPCAVCPANSVPNFLNCTACAANMFATPGMSLCQCVVGAAPCTGAGCSGCVPTTLAPPSGLSAGAVAGAGVGGAAAGTGMTMLVKYIMKKRSLSKMNGRSMMMKKLSQSNVKMDQDEQDQQDQQQDDLDNAGGQNTLFDSNRYQARSLTNLSGRTDMLDGGAGAMGGYGLPRSASGSGFPRAAGPAGAPARAYGFPAQRSPDQSGRAMSQSPYL